MHEVLFTDEATVKINVHFKRSIHKEGEPIQLTDIPNHPLGVHVWVSILRRGISQIHIVMTEWIKSNINAY